MGCAETGSSSVCVQISSAKTKELASIRPACQCWQRIHAWRMLSILSNIFLRNYELFNNSLWLYLTKVLSLVTLTCIYVKIYPLNLWPPHALTIYASVDVGLKSIFFISSDSLKIFTWFFANIFKLLISICVQKNHVQILSKSEDMKKILFKPAC